MSDFGIRIQERMAGWVRFFDTPLLNIDNDANYPFEININAFCNQSNYPFNFKFQGHAKMPGIPLPLDKNSNDAIPTVSGSMVLSHKGVGYNFDVCLPGINQVTIKGKKEYYYGFNLKKIIHSLITLPIYLYQDEKLIGEGKLFYLPALYKFFLGVHVSSKANAFEPRYHFSKKILPLVPIIIPDYKSHVSDEEIFKLVRQQVNQSSAFHYTYLKVGWLLFTLLVFFRFGKKIKNLNPNQKEKLVNLITNFSFLHILTVPLNMIIINSVYCSERFLSKVEQHKPSQVKINEEQKWSSLNITPTQQLEEIEVDVVVVGSGAGGAAIAYELSRKGHAVAIVEEGHYFQRNDMNGKRLEMMSKLYRNSGESFALSNSLIWLPTGKCVGGTTTINSGTCMRPPDKVLDRWEREIGLPKIDIQKYIPQVEQMLGNNPVSCNLQGSISEVLKKGIKDKNQIIRPLTRAEEGCDGQGLCILGCPTGAKRSTDVSYIVEALKNNAYLFSHYHAYEIITENGNACGIRARLDNYGEMFNLTIRSKKVVLATGALQTPRLLKSIKKLKNTNIGKNLTIHPSINIGAKFKDQIRNKLFVPQSMGVFYNDNRPYSLEGYTLQIDTLPVAFPLYGQSLIDFMNEHTKITNFASMITDPSYGRILFTKNSAIPYYKVTNELLKILNQSTIAIGNMFFDAGATEVYCPISGFEKITSKEQLNKLAIKKISPHYYKLSAHHPLGTCRMGNSPKNSVTDIKGAVWGLKDLYITDGSVIPGPLGANPQVTIMANSLRIANILHEELI